MEDTLQGGYRSRGQSPEAEAGLPVVSVITVVYNSLHLIEKTIRSIVNQSYPNIEYIVIDGGSSDGTVEIIRLYEERISYWISEPDCGIYDAMNKGLAAATGDYVWFMNAGDQIFAVDTLEKIFGGDRRLNPVVKSRSLPAKIFYGDTMIVDSGYREIGLRRLGPPEVLTWKSFKKGMLVSHQAIIVSRDLAEPFDPQYKHSADFDWVVRVLIKAQGSKLKAQVRMKDQGSRIREEGLRRSKGEEEVINNPELQSWDFEPFCESELVAFQPTDPSTHQPINPSTYQPVINTHLVLCAFLDGGHSKQNIGISLRERFHSMVRHYGLAPTVIRHIPIVWRFGWYYLKNRRY